MRKSLGISNNNPFNIRYSKINHWIGQTGENKGFCVFDSMDHGLRAGIITLKNYINKHGLTSVEQIIKRFAPASENPTSSYISYVDAAIRSYGCDPDNISFGSESFLIMCKAMCLFESWYSVEPSKISEVIFKFKIK